MKAAPTGAPAGVRTVIRTPNWRTLSRGMIIRAAIEARLLGKKLLTLDADIAILPAESESPVPAKAKLNGTPGAALAEAARSLESGASDLAAARRQMP